MHKSVPSLTPEPDDLISEEVATYPPNRLRRSAALRRRPGELRPLVFGTDAWLTWSVARCLIRERYAPVVLGPRALASLVRLAGGAFVPLSTEATAAVFDDVDAVCRAHDIDVVLPVDLPAIELAAQFASRERTARVAAIPDAASLARCTDRWRFAQLLASLGIPHAPAELATDADALRDTRLAFPVTTRSTAAADSSVRRYDSLTEITLALLDGAERQFPVVVEELTRGSPVGFAFLARHGRLMAHTAFEPRPRHAWRYFEAPELRGHCAGVVEATSYHGVGVLEAQYDPELHAYRVVALHPGFWHSHLCTERAGMNFPDLLARMPDIGPGAGFMARPRPVSLSYWERGVAGVIRLTALAESVHPRIVSARSP